jgi:hypothetical protein
MLIARDNPYALAAKYLFALSKCDRNKHDKPLCVRLRKLAIAARDLAYQRDVVLTETDFKTICEHRAQAVGGYKRIQKAYDSAVLDEL